MQERGAPGPVVGGLFASARGPDGGARLAASGGRGLLIGKSRAREELVPSGARFRSQQFPRRFSIGSPLASGLGRSRRALAALCETRTGRSLGLYGLGRCAGNGRRSGRSDRDRKSTRLNSSHSQISYAVFCLKKKKEALTRKRKRDYQ